MATLTQNIVKAPSPWRGVMGRHPACFTLLLYMVMYGIYALFDSKALSSYTFTNLINNASPLALAAAGQTLVVLARGFDLSIVGTLSIANVIMAVLPLEGPWGASVSLAICIGIGALVGTASGYLVAYRGLQSVAASLGVMIICQGIALLILPAPGGMVAEWVSDEMTSTLFSLVPASIILPVIVAGLWLLLRKTDLGTALYAVGADQAAAELSGIPVKRTRLLAYVMAGALYGVAGFMLSAQTATGDPNAGMPFLLLSFAAVALGGTSLAGGQGGLIGSLIGAATLMLMQKVLFSGGVSSFYIGLFQGVLLIVAIVIGRLINRSSAGDRS
jgi:ribose transport system permease protein